MDASLKDLQTDYVDVYYLMAVDNPSLIHSEEVYNAFLNEKFKSSSFNPFQRACAYVLQHGLEVVNADMQNFKHLEENIIAAAMADRDLS